MTKINQLADLGQAIWLDFISRKFVRQGGLQAWVDQGVRGVTSNPTIFEKAISGSADYDPDLEKLAREGKSVPEIFDRLAIDDIRQAADILRPVYDATIGADGFVSLEVNPELAHDTDKTISEAMRLWATVDRPNLMIKIPATLAGLPAITAALATGINVNVTLIFSLARYQAVMQAYLDGLEKHLIDGFPIDRLASVASFFVSRLDTKVDSWLEQIYTTGGPTAKVAQDLMGKVAVANTRLAYREFQRVFKGPSFATLQAAGARPQRPLWASTSTKNPVYPDILYVQKLIAPDTVNTLPEDTLEAFLDHGHARTAIDLDFSESEQVLSHLATIGISLDQATEELEAEGVASFAKSYQSLLASIAAKRQAIYDRPPRLEFQLGAYQKSFESALERLQREEILPRLWRQDYTIWRPDPDEISNRLGWLHIHREISTRLGQMEALSYAISQAGYTHALLLGMGGSSLAPELFARTFGPVSGSLQLSILDSTDPAAIQAATRSHDPSTTLYIVSTKSGGTVETFSFFKYFYNQTVDAVGRQNAGDHFIAITDPGSKLVDWAREYNFRATFLNDPNIGGRYSALSYFGMLPAALAGVDLEPILASAEDIARRSGPDVHVEVNPAALLGASLGSLAQAGRDKVTFLLSPQIESFGDWVEQLIAESTGKDNTGILPVVGESLEGPHEYGTDRVFVALTLPGDDSQSTVLEALAAAGHPVLKVPITSPTSLGGQFLLWELATAIAGYFLEIQPFDQPNVEAAKVSARAMLEAYRKNGSLPESQPVFVNDCVRIYADFIPNDPLSAIRGFLQQAEPGAYVSLQAFIQPTQERTAALQKLRHAIRTHTHLATTLGYGPRFLHSTGQLHKGDAGHGLFIQFTDNPQEIVSIPDQIGEMVSTTSFNTLKLAQALGDRQALLDAGRKVLRFHFQSPDIDTLTCLVDEYTRSS